MDATLARLNFPHLGIELTVDFSEFKVLIEKSTFIFSSSNSPEALGQMQGVVIICLRPYVSQ